MINPWVWLVGKVGATAARWIVLVLLILIVWGVALGVWRWIDWRNRTAVEAQADQTVASGEAINKAASEAVNTVVNRTEAENAIDAATAVAVERIGNAENSDDVRDAVVAHVCLHNAAYRNDPACALYRTDPR